MFSHVVIFWTVPEQPLAPDSLIAGCEKYLRNIPGIRFFHVGKMAPSPREVVDQSYQVALNIVFTDKAAQDAYQAHPDHLDFVAHAFKPFCVRAKIYDFA